ncbi:RNA-binding protein Musashi homolog Rbp6 [Eumeta japonica]|uniref:RNA-binding protein Musashi homolog Rbp6 n=1 Tax=Eumeta variegata TaxID=151549 RepID=A0A4C1UEW4_EUMVA|nr:RNA-binding protein Musashi homolog Rbp6 [Eumeta japonica]
MFAVDLTNGQLTPNNNTPLLAQALSGVVSCAVMNNYQAAAAGFGPPASPHAAGGRAGFPAASSPGPALDVYGSAADSVGYVQAASPQPSGFPAIAVSRAPLNYTPVGARARAAASATPSNGFLKLRPRSRRRPETPSFFIARRHLVAAVVVFCLASLPEAGAAGPRPAARRPHVYAECKTVLLSNKSALASNNTKSRGTNAVITLGGGRARLPPLTHPPTAFISPTSARPAPLYRTASGVAARSVSRRCDACPLLCAGGALGPPHAPHRHRRHPPHPPRALAPTASMALNPSRRRAQHPPPPLPPPPAPVATPRAEEILSIGCICKILILKKSVGTFLSRASAPSHAPPRARASVAVGHLPSRRSVFARCSSCVGGSRSSIRSEPARADGPAPRALAVAAFDTGDNNFAGARAELGVLGVREARGGGHCRFSPRRPHPAARTSLHYVAAAAVGGGRRPPFSSCREIVCRLELAAPAPRPRAGRGLTLLNRAGCGAAPRAASPAHLAPSPHHIFSYNLFIVGEAHTAAFPVRVQTVVRRDQLVAAFVSSRRFGASRLRPRPALCGRSPRFVSVSFVVCTVLVALASLAGPCLARRSWPWAAVAMCSISE